MCKPYTLSVKNTMTDKYESVPVTEEVYRAYKQTGWNIDDNNTSFYDHEIQFSQLIGGGDGAYENFHEFVSDADATLKMAMNFFQKDLLHKAMASLTKNEVDLIIALYVDGMTEREYAAEIGIPQKTINDRKRRIFKKLKKFMEFEK